MKAWWSQLPRVGQVALGIGALVVFVMGCSYLVAPDENEAVRTVTETVAANGGEPTPPAVAAVTPKPSAEHESKCAYVLGNFSETASGKRFLAGATVENTGNIGVLVRVTASWEQLGTAPVVERKRVKVLPNAERKVAFTHIASHDELDLHQAADGKCNVAVKIVGTFGKAIED